MAVGPRVAVAAAVVVVAAAKAAARPRPLFPLGAMAARARDQRHRLLPTIQSIPLAKVRLQAPLRAVDRNSIPSILRARVQPLDRLRAWGQRSTRSIPLDRAQLRDPPMAWGLNRSTRLYPRPPPADQWECLNRRFLPNPTTPLPPMAGEEPPPRPAPRPHHPLSSCQPLLPPATSRCLVRPPTATTTKRGGRAPPTCKTSTAAWACCTAMPPTSMARRT